jgi:hypothetical protein
MDDRATGQRCIEAWTTGQTFPRERYEVIALAPGVDSELEAAVRPILREGDRWIEHDTRTVVELLNVGARAARGELLSFTEAHCEPDPRCLNELVSHLRETGAPGVRGSSVGRAKGPLGGLERDVYRDAIATGEQSGHWNRVVIHSFAIHRDVFLEAGGFESRLGDFSNYALGIELSERGHELGFAPSAIVYHTYDGELRGLVAHLRDFGRGEADYQASAPAPLRRRYLDEISEWTNRWAYTRAGARLGLRAAFSLRHTGPGVPQRAARHGLMAAGGARAVLSVGQAEVALRRLAVRFTRGRRSTGAASLDALWRRSARLGRVESIGELAPPLQPRPEPSLEYDLCEREGARMMGFHVVEKSDGRAFRWTGPLALLEVCLPEGGPFEAALEMPPVRPPYEPHAVRIAVDGRRVAVTVEPELLRFSVANGGVHWIAFASNAMRPRRSGSEDHRDLGLAVSSLRFA